MDDAAPHERPHPAFWLRVFYIVTAALILAPYPIPALRRRFLVYGSRATPAKASAAKPAPRATSKLDEVLDAAASALVPHNFFTHFYVVSVTSSLFWGWRYSLWKADGTVRIVWALMLLQGSRRLYESYTYTSGSKSQMWVGHWLIGLAFYAATNMAVWADADAMPSDLDVLDWKKSLLIPGILLVQFLQNSYHAHLYRLRTQNKGYQLPSHPMFSLVVCPHYTCDIAVYVLMSFLAAPVGQLVNWTWVCAAIFTASNLALTAAGQKQWYADKFGEEKVRGKKRIVPWVW